jgi:nucleotide-binding universal stress UspA family protein
MPQLWNVKNVFVVFNEEGQGELSSALGYGLSLAQAADAHVTVHASSVSLDLPSAHRSSAVAGLVAEENARVRQLSEKVGEKMRGDAAMAGVVCDTEALQATYVRVKSQTLAKARVSDIIVVDADPSILTVDGGLLRMLIFESGRPTIVTPPGSSVFACDRIIVAWDGSAAAARAVAAAMPYLKASSEVEVVCYLGEKELSRSAAGADLAVALVRHGVKATVKGLTSGDDVAKLLCEQAALFRADMIVMGAFVHSPIRQWLFGGVTQSMLSDTPVPVLLSH